MLTDDIESHYLIRSLYILRLMRSEGTTNDADSCSSLWQDLWGPDIDLGSVPSHDHVSSSHPHVSGSSSSLLSGQVFIS